MTNTETGTAEVPLTTAALRLRFSREKTLRWLLSGKLDGRQDPVSGRWLVSAASVEHYERQSAA